MNITLRQAHKLVDKINGRLATIQVSATQQINIWEVEDPAAAFENLQEQYTAQCNRNRELVSARQTIRDLISVANQQGVNATVAQRKAIMDEIGFLRHQLNTVNDNTVNSSKAFARKVAAERESAKSNAAGYRDDIMVVCVLSSVDVDSIQNIINQRQLDVERAEEQLAKLNSSIEVTLPVSVEHILQREGLM